MPLIEIPEEHGGVVCRGLIRSFGAVQAVRGIDMDAPPGQVTALVGPNGSGKTTLLLVLATLLVPDAGTVRVGGFDPVTQPAQVRARTGWTPDVFGVYDSLTAAEYLTFFARAHRLPADRVSARVGELLELVHLDAFADQPVSVLSRGQKQRLGLTRALVHSPQVLPRRSTRSAPSSNWCARPGRVRTCRRRARTRPTGRRSRGERRCGRGGWRSTCCSPAPRWW